MEAWFSSEKRLGGAAALTLDIGELFRSSFALIKKERAFPPTMIEEELFTRAIELPQEERAAFLKEACGDDDALRRTLEGLLSAHNMDSALLDSPCVEACDIVNILGEEGDGESPVLAEDHP